MSHLIVAESSAEFSPCRRYRYVLRRVFAEGPSVMFVGLNPSTADEARDDPTIRRCLGFARRWGYGTLIMANLYAWRATDPRELRAAPWPDGGKPHDYWLRRLAAEADLIVAAWGADPGPVPHRPALVLRILQASLERGRLVALGVTKHGQPRHPLYARGAAVPVDYPIKEAAG